MTRHLFKIIGETIVGLTIYQGNERPRNNEWK